jgi:hypothetical protein
MGQARRRRLATRSSATPLDGAAAAPPPELKIVETAPAAELPGELEVRLCVPDDLPALVTLGLEYHAEAGDDRLPLDLEKSMRWMYYAITRNLAICVERDGIPVGAMILNEDPPWWSSANALWEAGFFVNSVARKGTGAADLLVETAKAIAEDMGVPLIVTPMTDVDVERKDRWFRTKGFRRIGGFYRWDRPS